MFKIRRKKSYYYKFRASLLLVLLVPMLTIGLVFVQAQNMIREQILLASKNTLNQFFLRIDDMTEESRNICLSLVNSSECRDYATYTSIQSEKAAYQEVRVRNVMQGYLGERYYDIFIYYPSMDRIISGRNTSNDLDEYYDIYYKNNENDFREKFREMVSNASVKATLSSMNGKTDDSYLCVSIKNNAASKGVYDYVAVVVLNPAYVSEVLSEMDDGEQGGIPMIFSDAGELIMAASDTAEDYCLSKASEDNVLFEDRIDGVEYIFQVMNSDIVDAYYAYAVSEKYFWSKLHELYVICSIGSIVTIAIGIFLVGRQSKKVYQPIGEIVDNLQQEGSISYDADNNTEFEFIEALFQREKEDKQGLSRKIRKGEAAKRDQFIFSLLMGSAEISEKGNDIFRENGITLCSDYFYVMVLQIENNGNLEQDMLNFIISNVYTEIYSDENMSYIIPLEDRRYVILVNKMLSDDTEIFELMKKGVAFLKNHYAITMTCGISARQEGVQGIHAGYQEACQALKYRYFMGNESIIAYQQIADRGFHYPNTSALRMPHMVSDYLSGNSGYHNSNELVIDIMTIYEIDESISIETMECFKFEVVSMLKRVMIQSGCDDAEWKSNAMELLGSGTLEVFEEKLAEIVDRLFTRMQEKADQKDICTMAMEYIEEHYPDEQLSLTMLGERAGIAPSYLSKLFKAKYQISIPDYIAKVRVNHAKQQLRDTDLSIHDIAEHNGFLNDNSFIRTFKRQEGITPGVYRGFFKQEN